MYKTVITSNHHNRQFKYRYDVPEDVLDWYDWLNEEDSLDGWICYKGHWSHISDYLKNDNNSYWHGYKSDSYSDGMVIKISDDGETYKIGSYYIAIR
jgi:hypothetical protein